MESATTLDDILIFFNNQPFKARKEFKFLNPEIQDFFMINPEIQLYFQTDLCNESGFFEISEEEYLCELEEPVEEEPVEQEPVEQEIVGEIFDEVFEKEIDNGIKDEYSPLIITPFVEKFFTYATPGLLDIKIISYSDITTNIIRYNNKYIINKWISENLVFILQEQCVRMGNLNILKLIPVDKLDNKLLFFLAYHGNFIEIADYLLEIGYKTVWKTENHLNKFSDIAIEHFINNKVYTDKSEMLESIFYPDEINCGRMLNIFSKTLNISNDDYNIILSGLLKYRYYSLIKLWLGEPLYTINIKSIERGLNTFSFLHENSVQVSEIFDLLCAKGVDRKIFEKGIIANHMKFQNEYRNKMTYIE